MPHLVNVLLIVWMHFLPFFFFWWGGEGEMRAGGGHILFCLYSLIYHTLRFKITTCIKSFSIFSFFVSTWSIIWCILQLFNYYPFTQVEGRVYQSMQFSACYLQGFARAVLWPSLCLHLGRIHFWVGEPTKESHCDGLKVNQGCNLRTCSSG